MSFNQVRTVGLSAIHSVLTNPTEDGFSHLFNLYSSLRISEIYHNFVE